MIFDVAVIGGGIGGYPAAIHLSRNKLKVALISDGPLGGECTNYGCIPTKALISRLARGEKDWNTIKKHALKNASETRRGIEKLLELYKVRVYRSKAKLSQVGSNYRIAMSDGKIIEARKIILATGSSPAIPSILNGLPRVLDNRSILTLEKTPRSILILGGGAVGVEYARIMASLGVRTLLVEKEKKLLPSFPRDLSKQVHDGLSELGVDIYTSTTLEEIHSSKEYLQARLGDGTETAVEYVLNATGRKPNTKDIGLEETGVELTEEGYIRTDKSMGTSNGDIYAAGDATGPPLLAHKAYHQSLTAAENILGRNEELDAPIPVMVFSHPEVAYVGMTWSEARRKGYKAERKRIPLNIHARSRIEGWSKGYARITYDKETRTILGFEIAGPLASEIIGLASYLVANKASLETIRKTILPHPTMTEIIRELEEVVLKKSVHLYVDM